VTTMEYDMHLGRYPRLVSSIAFLTLLTCI
jgi:hypothetical protein